MDSSSGVLSLLPGTTKRNMLIIPASRIKINKKKVNNLSIMLRTNQLMSQILITITAQ
jgi:hypothetical protein